MILHILRSCPNDVSYMRKDPDLLLSYFLFNSVLIIYTILLYIYIYIYVYIYIFIANLD